MSKVVGKILGQLEDTKTNTEISPVLDEVTASPELSVITKEVGEVRVWGLELADLSLGFSGLGLDFCGVFGVCSLGFSSGFVFQCFNSLCSRQLVFRAQ